jgi:hypothetical protein
MKVARLFGNLAAILEVASSLVLLATTLNNLKVTKLGKSFISPFWLEVNLKEVF